MKFLKLTYMNLLKNYVLILGVGLLGMMSCSDKDSLEEIDDSRLPAIEEGALTLPVDIML